MITEITLTNLSFFCFHGFYEEERKLGANYLVNVTLTVDIDNEQLINDELNHTINYEQVYIIVSKVMNNSTKLLETLVAKICFSMMDEFVLLQKIEASVSKCNPPIGGNCENTTVKMIHYRDNAKL